MHLTPYHLFEYLSAIAGGLFLVGLSLLVLLLLFVAVVGYAKRSEPRKETMPTDAVIIRQD